MCEKRTHLVALFTTRKKILFRFDFTSRQHSGKKLGQKDFLRTEFLEQIIVVTNFSDKILQQIILVTNFSDIF
jgi:hypothetical protein